MGTDLHLLIVEDSLDDTKLLLRELSHGGFDPTWERVETESALTDALNRQAWDLVIADFTMPGFSGRQALTVLRARDADLPFIFVSGTIGEEVAVEAMKAGAHDFIMKGNLSRLVPAIERELRDAAARREHRRAAARVQHLAYYDVLTDLPNRALLYDRLGQGLAAAQREHTSLAFLMMDLDGFKETNDTLGHRVGDLLLQQVGQRLQGALREVDTIARLGGDEFAVVLPGADADTVTLLTHLILGAVQQPFRAEGRTLDVRASLGVALYPTHGTTPDLLMQRADAAMYVAKETRSGWAVYAPAADRHGQQPLAPGGDLRQVIEAHEFVLHRQPKVRLRSRQSRSANRSSSTLRAPGTKSSGHR